MHKAGGQTVDLFTITLDREGKSPLYAQLYAHIAAEIRGGRLLAGERLPSKRNVAAHLQISQNTVEGAYDLLVQEGYLYTLPRSGFYVSKIEKLSPPPEAPPSPEPEKASPLQNLAYAYDFRTNAVDAESFPYKTWAKLNRAVLTGHENLLTAGEPQGDYPLREVLCKYLHEFRGVRCQPEQMVIGAGIEYLLTLLTQLLERPLFAVEDPGYDKAAKLLTGSGGRVVYLPLDREGMEVSALMSSGAQVAYITPSHQFPTGLLMSIARRSALLRWAGEQPERYLIEDDYNGEFTFSGKPIPAVQGMDSNGRVIYMSTFSRILAPSFRIAYMVMPETLLARFREMFSSHSSTVSRFEQHTLLAFIQGGYLGRHLNRVKHIYKKRRDFLLGKLQSYDIPGGIKVSGERAGLHLLVKLSPPAVKTVLDRAQRENIRLFRVSDFVRGGSQVGENLLILGYAGMSEEKLEKALDFLFSDLR